MATADQLKKKEETDRMAALIIETETEARRKKTEKLRQARLAAENRA